MNRNMWVVHCFYIVSIILLALKVLDNDQMILASYTKFANETVVMKKEIENNTFKIDHIEHTINNTVSVDKRNGVRVDMSEKLTCSMLYKFQANKKQTDSCNLLHYRPK